MGSSIIEMVIVLVAAAAMTVLGIQQDVAKHRAGVLATEGQNELTIVDALGEWANDNYATILSAYMASGSSSITPPTIAQLYTAGNLKQPHGNGPFWGGTYVIQMSMVPAGCTEAAGNCAISYAMYTSLPLRKGAQYDVDGASQIAQAGGAQFGFSRTQGASTINGLNGGWTATNPLGNLPAVVLATNGPGTDGNSLYIRRDGSLTWTGSQDVNGVDLHNVGSIDATGTIAAPTSVSRSSGCSFCANTASIDRPERRSYWDRHRTSLPASGWVTSSSISSWGRGKVRALRFSIQAIALVSHSSVARNAASSASSLPLRATVTLAAQKL